MKTERYDGGRERRAVIAMITSDRALAAIAPLCRNGPAFPSRWADIVARWCVTYHDTHSSAPGKAIESLFSSWAGTREARGDVDTVNLVERFISSLSEEYETQDLPADEHLIEEGRAVILKAAVRRLATELEDDAAGGDVTRAMERVEAFRSITSAANGGGCIDVLRDADGVRGAIERSLKDPLVTFPGDLGRMLAPASHRDMLLAFQAPEKRAKSFHLINFAWRAMQQRRHTLFYACGDMTAEQMHARFIARAAKRPMKPRNVQYPVKLERIDGERVDYKVTHEIRKWKEPMTFQEGWRAYQDSLERYVRDDASFLDMYVHPAGTLSVATINGECKRRAQAGRPADVVVIDYADLLMPPPGLKESRDKINAVWTSLRALSAEHRCLVVTATQARADSYRKRTQDMRDFSDDKRKLAHATGIVGINQTSDEKRLGLQRLNWLVLREDDFVSERCCVVAGCLALAMPAIRSTF